MAFLWMGVCVAAAMICATIRVQRPELATGISLAVGAAVLAAMAVRAGNVIPEARRLWGMLSSIDADAGSAMLRAAGITVIAELAAQLCRDAGERALAGRVSLIARASILALCVPLVSRLAELLGRFAS